MKNFFVFLSIWLAPIWIFFLILCMLFHRTNFFRILRDISFMNWARARINWLCLWNLVLCLSVLWFIFFLRPFILLVWWRLIKILNLLFRSWFFLFHRTNFWRSLRDISFMNWVSVSINSLCLRNLVLCLSVFWNILFLRDYHLILLLVWWRLIEIFNLFFRWRNFHYALKKWWFFLRFFRLLIGLRIPYFTFLNHRLIKWIFPSCILTYIIVT